MVEYNSVIDIQFNDIIDIVEPVTLEEVKTFCKIDITTDDDILVEMITSAREMCEDYSGIGFVLHNLIAVLNNSNGGIYLPYGPTGTITSIVDSNGNTLSSLDDYELVGGAFKSILTPKNERLTVTYTSGYTELPKRLKLALLNTIYYLYDNRAQSIDHIYDKNVPTIGNLGPISEMILKPLRRVI